MENTFYRDFEDRYRGSRELIKTRLSAYAELLGALRSLSAAPLALDLGCGRGEWLELLRENGFEGRGVDLDEGMLQACREHGLQVENIDALSALGASPDGSLALVSAFHVVEHIGFDDLRNLTSLALRKLVPGGLLILETPNPENLAVGTSNFYLDPTHIKPIPPSLLGFVAEHAGFQRYVVMRLNEAPELHTRSRIGLISVLDGVSPDYAVVAQKQAPAAISALFDAAFDKPYGLSLPALAARYDGERQAELGQIEQAALERLARTEEVTARTEEVAGRVEQLRADLGQLSGQVEELRPQSAELRARVQEVGDQLLRASARSTDMERRLAVLQVRFAGIETRLSESEKAHDRVTEHLERAHLAEMRLQAAEFRIRELHASTSWKLTRPWRALGALTGRPRPHPLTLLSKIARKLGLHAPARSIYRRLRGISPDVDAPAPAPIEPAAPPPAPPPSAPATGELSEDARLIVRQLGRSSTSATKVR